MTRTPARTVITVIALVGLGAMPGVATNGIVDGPATVIVGAAVSAVAAIVALTVRRTAALVTVGLAGSLVIAGVVTAAAPVQPERSFASAVVDALTHGWSTIVRSPVPADAEPRMLVPIALVCWVATLGGVASSRGRTAAVTPLLPAVVAIVAAAVAAGGAQYRPVASGLAVLVLAGAVAAARAPSTTSTAPAASSTGAAQRGGTRSGSLARQVGAGGAVIATIVVVALAAGPSLAFGRDDDPFDPRDHWVPPALPAGATSPLDLVTARLQLPDQVMFTIDAAAPTSTRLAAFDAFDGATWATSGSYQRTGAVLPTVPPAGVPSSTATATITIAGLTGPWLPTVAETTRLEGTPVLIEPLSASVVAEGGTAAGTRYSIEATVSAPVLTELQGAPAAEDPAALAALVIGDDVPPALREMAEVATAGASSPLTKAALLELYLRRNFTITPDAIGGYTYGHLVRTLTGNGRGTAAQFAAAFVVLGRLVGLPTRLVVGFGPGEPVDGRYEVRSGDVAVWPEVRFRDAGWIAFDPAPPLGAGSGDDGGGTVSIGVGPGADVVVEPSTDRPDDVGGDPEATATTPADRDDGSGRRWGQLAAVTGAVLAAVAVLGALVVIVWKRRRTLRRRQAAEPRRQVLGAWHDVLDRLREDGVADVGQRTVGELVARTETTSGALAGLYRPVNRALYDDQPVTAEDAERAWRARDRYVDDVRRREPTHRRVRRSVDPRPLLTRPRERVLEDV